MVRGWDLARSYFTLRDDDGSIRHPWMGCLYTSYIANTGSSFWYMKKRKNVWMDRTGNHAWPPTVANHHNVRSADQYDLLAPQCLPSFMVHLSCGKLIKITNILVTFSKICHSSRGTPNILQGVIRFLQKSINFLQKGSNHCHNIKTGRYHKSLTGLLTVIDYIFQLKKICKTDFFVSKAAVHGQ